MSMPLMPGLKVESGGCWLASDHEHYRIIEASIDLGPSLLETPEGRESLRRVAKFILDELDEKAKAKEKRQKKDDKKKGKDTGSSVMYQEPRESLRDWIGFFLKSMRADFPQVYIDPGLAGEAAAVRADWATNARGLRDYRARDAGYVLLNGILVDNMVNCRQLPQGDAYDTFKFQMAICVAHEVVHLFTGFLTGTARPNTPKRVTLLGYGDGKKGEAGRYWESVLLGGVVEWWSSTTDPLGLRQAGSPYLFEHGTSKAEGSLVSSSYIANFLAGKFTFPIRTESAVTTRDTLKKASRVETTDLRKKCKQRKEKAPVIPTPEAGGRFRYRKTEGETDPGPVQAGGSSHSWYR